MPAGFLVRAGTARFTGKTKKIRVKKQKKPTKTIRVKKVRSLVNRQIMNRSETIYARFFSYDVRTSYAAVENFEALDAPVACPGVQNPASGAASCYVLQTGEYLSPASVVVNTPAPGGSAMIDCCNVMGGFKLLQGDTNRTISGNYAHSLSHKLSITIAMKTVRNENNLGYNYLPTHFRVLYVRPKAHSETQTASLAGGLFLSEYGDRKGIASENISTKFLHEDAIVNPGQWTKVKEYKFSLVPAVQPPGQYTTSEYPVLIQQPAKAYKHEQHLDIWLDSPKKKLKFNDANSVNLNDHEPMNYDFTNYIVIIATTGNPSQNGTNDSRAWTLQASGTSKFKDV